MKYDNFGENSLNVSKICLGTMTWGEQNNEREAHEQLDYALERGVNFIDTAELYAIPINPETYGHTERIIGNWLKNQDREKIVLASKVSGPGPKHIRNGPDFSVSQLEKALNESLKRLKTDYIDLYQLHWPERKTNFFGQLGYKHHSSDVVSDFKQVLETLHRFVKEGKIRYVGISNETPWGFAQYLKYSEGYDLPRIATIQNPYSLINRTFEIGLSEMSIRENVGLLAYSPLGGGLLSGKYLAGQKPKNSRYTNWPNYFNRYSHSNTQKAIEEYDKLSAKLNLSLAQLSLAFVNQQEFLTSNIIGATTMKQLKENIDSIDVELEIDVINEIEKIHLNFPNPAP